MPQAPLALGDDGKFYGPCFNFGPNSKYGTLFKITPAEIISRNLTPHCTGRPAGGRYAQFVQIMRSGTDFDHLHATGSGAVNTGCVQCLEVLN